MDAILREFQTLNTLCDDCRSSTEQFPRIKAVHVARRNLREMFAELDFYDLIPTMVMFQIILNCLLINLVERWEGLNKSFERTPPNCLSYTKSFGSYKNGATGF